jgi:hypothetical protein
MPGPGGRARGRPAMGLAAGRAMVPRGSSGAGASGSSAAPRRRSVRGREASSQAPGRSRPGRGGGASRSPARRPGRPWAPRPPGTAWRAEVPAVGLGRGCGDAIRLGVSGRADESSRPGGTASGTAGAAEERGGPSRSGLQQRQRIGSARRTGQLDVVGVRPYASPGASCHADAPGHRAAACIAEVPGIDGNQHLGAGDSDGQPRILVGGSGAPRTGRAGRPSTA